MEDLMNAPHVFAIQRKYSINSIIYLNCQTFPLKSQKQFSSNFFIWHLNNLWNLISGYYLQNNKLFCAIVSTFDYCVHCNNIRVRETLTIQYKKCYFFHSYICCKSEDVKTHSVWWGLKWPNFLPASNFYHH